MAHMIIVDDRPATPNFGKPLFCAVTLISTPPVYVCAVRIYSQSSAGKTSVSEVWAKELPKELDRKVRINREKASTGSEWFKRFGNSIVQTTVLVASIPKDAGLSQKKPFLFEVGIGGNGGASLEYALSILGKKVTVRDLFKPGMYVDTVAITKGKGLQGPVKRFGIKRKPHKARKSVRAVGTLGPIAPGNVMFSVPRAGQMGFHQRTEFNKRIMTIGNAQENDPTPAGGFNRFGRLKGDYMVLRGSIPGPQKRLVILRHPARPPPSKIQEPRILEIVLPTS